MGEVHSADRFSRAAPIVKGGASFCVVAGIAGLALRGFGSGFLIPLQSRAWTAILLGTSGLMAGALLTRGRSSVSPTHEQERAAAPAASAGEPVLETPAPSTDAPKKKRVSFGAPQPGRAGRGEDFFCPKRCWPPIGGVHTVRTTWVDGRMCIESNHPEVDFIKDDQIETRHHMKVVVREGFPEGRVFQSLDKRYIVQQL